MTDRTSEIRGYSGGIMSMIITEGSDPEVEIVVHGGGSLPETAIVQAGVRIIIPEEGKDDLIAEMIERDERGRDIDLRRDICVL